MRRASLLGLALVGVLSLTLSCARLPEANEFHVGLTRTQLLDRYGQPAQTQRFHKTGDNIFGPIEEFWPKIPRGSMVEIWAYRVTNGTVELYFIDGAQQVQGTGFAPTGAVF